MPLFSLVTSTYNAADSISDCIESVINQNIDVEHIIVDGASNDNTMEIVNKYKEYLSHVVSAPDDGIYDAMNKGLKLATGDIVGLLNADDYYPSNDVLEKVSRVFENSSVEACYGDLVYVDNSDIERIVRYWKTGNYNPDKFYWGWMPPHPTLFVRRSVYEKYGVFKPELGTAADYEIMLRFLLKHKINVSYIPEILVKMRVGGVSNVSLMNRIAANRMDRKAWQVNGLTPYPWTLWAKPIRKIGQWFRRPDFKGSNVNLDSL